MGDLLASLEAVIGNTYVQYGACVVILLLVLNLALSHRMRVKRQKQREVEKTLKRCGLVNYQENMKKKIEQCREIDKPLYDLSGIFVRGGLNASTSEEADDVIVGELCEEEDEITLEIEDEEALMGLPTNEELEIALQTAAAMRESGADERYLAKCLLNLNYRNQLLEKVLEHAELYMRTGGDPHEHTQLLKAVQAAKGSGQLKQEKLDRSAGTFLIS